MPDQTPARGLSRATRLSALRAFLAGRAARRAGQDATACPYSPDAVAEDPSDATVVAGAALERFHADNWIKGWSRG